MTNYYNYYNIIISYLIIVTIISLIRFEISNSKKAKAVLEDAGWTQLASLPD